MCAYMAVPDGDILFEPQLDDDEYEELSKDLKKVEGLHIDQDGLFMDVYEWFPSEQIDKALEHLASLLKALKIRAKGSFYIFKGYDEGNIMKSKSSFKLSLRGGHLKKSKGQIRPVRPRRSK